MTTEFVKIHFDVRSMEKDIKALPKITRGVTVGTLNKVVRKANTAGRKFITSHYNIKARSMKIGGLVSIKRADARKADPLTASIFIRQKARGLFKYGAKQLKSGGVGVKVTKTRKKLKSAFISSWRRGGIQQPQFVFRKATGKNAGKITRISRTGTRYEADKRESLVGPSVAQLYGSRKTRNVMNKVVRLNFRPIFDADFRKKMAKRK